MKNNNNDRLTRILEHHVGLGGDEAHPDVDYFQSGFMPKETFSEHNQIFKSRKMIKGQDILKLDPGYYGAYNMTNHPIQTDPTTWFSEIEVTQSAESGGRKFFKLYDSVSGLSYCRTTDLTGDPASGTGFWIKNVNEVVLWSGWSDFSNPTTLAYPVDSFSDVYVKYGTSVGNVGRAYGDNKSVMINTINNNDAGIGINTYEAQLVFNKNSATIVGNNQMIIGASENNQPGIIQKTNGDISISRIVGVK